MNVHDKGVTAPHFPLHAAPVEMPGLRILLRAWVQEQVPTQSWLTDLVHGWGYSLLNSEQAHAQERAEKLVAALSPRFAASPANDV